MEIRAPRWAERFIGAMLLAKAGGRSYKSSHAPQGTPPRLHRRNHNDTSPGTSIRGRLVRGRFQ